MAELIRIANSSARSPSSPVTTGVPRFVTDSKKDISSSFRGSWFGDEIRQLLKSGIPSSAKPFEAIGYRHVIADLDSCIPRDETIRIIQRDTRRYAKRQMTWFRKQSNVCWFDGPGDSEEIKNKVCQYLEKLVNF